MLPIPSDILLPNEKISPTDECTFCGYSFEELIKQKTERDPPRPYIIALTRATDGRLRVYDADSLLQTFDRFASQHAHAVDVANFRNLPPPQQRIFRDAVQQLPYVRVHFLVTWQIKDEFELLEECTDYTAARARKFVKAAKSEIEDEVLELVKSVVRDKLADRKYTYAEMWLKLLAHDYPSDPFVFNQLQNLMRSYRTGTKDLQQNIAKADALEQQLKALKKAAMIHKISRCILPAWEIAKPLAVGFLGSFALTNGTNRILPLLDTSNIPVSLSIVLAKMILEGFIPPLLALGVRPHLFSCSKKIKHLFLAGWNINLWKDFFSDCCSLDSTIPTTYFYDALISTCLQVIAEPLERCLLRFNPHMNDE